MERGVCLEGGVPGGAAVSPAAQAGWRSLQKMGEAPVRCVWGSSDLMVQTETSVSAGSGETPQSPCPEHLPTPHDFISPLTPLLPLWTCVPKRGGSPRLLTNGYLLFNPTGLVDPKVVSQRPLSLAEGMTVQSWEN